MHRTLNLRRSVAGIRRLSTGLYGIDVLKTPKCFRRFVDDAIEKSGELVSYISRLPPSVEVVKAMDEISNTVCAVLDSAELCRNTHPEREYVEEANLASMRMNEYLHFLNTNSTLYSSIVKVEQQCVLQQEAQRAVHMLRVDFEKGGIHLPEDKLQRVNQLNVAIAQLGTKFNENIAIDPGFVDVFPASCIPKHMQHLFRPIYRQTIVQSNESVESREKRGKEKGLRISTDPSTLSSVLKWVSVAEVRKQVYIKGNTVPRANLTVLDELISARDELAQIIGCKSYSEFAIRHNMAGSPDVVMRFLVDLSKTIRCKADEEFKTIQEYKRKLVNDNCADLEPWDESHFIGMMKSSSYNLDSSVISSYFSVPQCLDGLKFLVESLFGATFQTVPLAPGESWHPDVMKLSLHHPDEGDLGFLYLDLYSRKGKFPGCAHFAVRGGRRISGTEYQLPIVALVCNFSGSSGLSSRINHSDVETLFHEFGHALHSLLSRTEYQHFSGTRVVLDIAEVPSNLFEYYAWDYRVLRRFAKHHTTGDAIPEKLVEAMNGARNKFSAIDLQRQIFYSLLDLTLFGENKTSSRDTVSVAAELKREHTSWKNNDGTHWHTRFSHLINYGAGYYSYLYAKCLAATIWQDVCQEDPLSEITGSILREKFLKHGGAKDPVTLLKDLSSKNIVRSDNGGIIPDTKSLFNEMGL